MVEQSTLLLRATIMEGIVLTIVTFVVTMLYIRYFRRRKSAALSLAVAFTFWDLANISLFICRLLEYLKEIGEIVSEIGFSDLGINLGYGFSAISNVFIFLFVAIVFSQSPMFRRTGMLMPLIFGALNGITVGMIIGSTTNSWPTPTYDLMPTIYHLVLTLISFGTLIGFTIRPLKFASLKWERAGFRFIIASGVFGILIYISFVLDLLLGTSFLNVWGHGYTMFFFFAYVLAILMCSSAYLGYVMPNFVRKWYKDDVEEESTF
ncbi:MAG: hypothetical protein HZR80_19790 [Candidatus Heimdallarchaeota archaeon]